MVLVNGQRVTEILVMGSNGIRILKDIGSDIFAKDPDAERNRRIRFRLFDLLIFFCPRRTPLIIPSFCHFSFSYEIIMCIFFLTKIQIKTTPYFSRLVWFNWNFTILQFCYGVRKEAKFQDEPLAKNSKLICLKSRSSVVTSLVFT